MRAKFGLLTTTVCFGFLAMYGVAHATPYAYASNEYSGLRLVQVVNGVPSALPNIGSRTETIAASAQYQGFAPSAYQATQTIPIFPATGTLDVTQAFAGSGTPPAENTFGQAGPGTFNGTRADTNIGGADNTGAITVNNVAEGNGGGLGNSNANNNATIVFSVDLQTASQIQLSFINVVSLIASTSQAGESATASITNTFSITQGSIGGISYTYAPSDINGQLSSQDGVPASNTYSDIFHGYYLSPVLTPGLYNISFTSASSETVQGIPEPASLALLGAGLIGLGFSRRRRQAA